MKRIALVLLTVPLGACGAARTPAVLDAGPPETPWEFFRRKYDADGSGFVSFAEYDRDGERFARLDRNADGFLTPGDFADHGIGESALARLRRRWLEAPATRTTPREPRTGPTVGTVAPDFELSAPGGGPPVRLSGFAGEKPVALVFGSYT